MTDKFDFAFDDIRPRTWSDAFPWLAGAAGTSGATWRDRPIDDTDFDSRQSYLSQISTLAMERLTHWTIGQIFPGLSPEIDLVATDLPVRAINAVARNDSRWSGDLMAVQLDDVLSWRQVGVGTVDAILRWLADASTSAPTPPVAHHGHQLPSGSSFSADPVRLPEWMSSLVDDLSTIAEWYSTIGLATRPLLGAPVPRGTPAEVMKARQRIEALSPTHVLSEGETELDVAALFDDALTLLDSRAAEVLGERLFADEPATLDQLGQVHGVTRERIRQIEGKARGAMLSFISEEGPLAAVAESARDLIGTIRPLQELLELIPALGRNVETVGRPAWRVLDRLDDAYEIEDGWCVVPTLTAARTVTQTLLQERADQYGVVRIAELDLIETSHPENRDALTERWLEGCGYLIDGSRVLTRTSSVGDYAAAILSMHGEPMSAQGIVDRFRHERTTGSLKNAMSIDDRFERVDRDSWALREWGMESYGSIRSVIRKELAKSGGAIDIDTLVERITGTYSVTSNSVIAYASTPPFELREGVVQAAEGSRENRKPPERTNRMYRRSDAWIYRVRINHDHLRGSGSVAPVAITTILDMEYGDKVQLASSLGNQAIHWTGTQPSFGTIRRYLLEGDVAAGTEAFLVLGDDRTFNVEVIAEASGDPLADALSLVGAPNTLDMDAARQALAAAICLPDESPVVSIIGAYRDRGDGDVADLLIAARQHLESSAPTAATPRSADVDDIMDLL